ncbi:MAG TPA: hypothetical protein VGV59_06250 [Pyrinomonadaceae bacterium]|nr:hypothetical protein [Pyrinomonadaceae bacterium]
MSDPVSESTQNRPEQTPDAALASRLSSRLLARATNSLGVIDVRHVERRYARIMDWLAARTPLVEHLKERYGLTEDEGARTLGLAFADASGGAGVEGSDAIASHTLTAQSMAAPVEQLFTAVAHVPEDSDSAPAPTMRITRRGLPTFSHADAQTHAQRAHTQPEVSENDRRTPEQSIADPVRPPLPDLAMPSVREVHEAPVVIETPHAGQTPTPHEASAPPLLPDGSSPDAAGQSISSVIRTAEIQVHTEGFLVSTGELLTTRPVAAASVRETARPNTSQEKMTLPASRPDVTQAAPTSDASHLPLETSTGALRQARVRADQADRRRTASTPEELEPSLVRRVVSESARRARAGGAEVEESTLASEAEATNVARGSRLPLAQAREIIAASFEHETQARRASSNLPLAAAQVNGDLAAASQTQHQHQPAATAAHAVMQVSAGGAETDGQGRASKQAKAAGVNVEKLAEQVSRHLTRKLLVERERRGLGRR